MPEDKDTISEAILRFLENSPSWWSRSEIALAIGRSKTSQLVRALEALTAAGYIMRSDSREHGRNLFVYKMPQTQADRELPF